MDNEPELWGYTHYDVHPECPTYEEILDKYLRYARAIRERRARTPSSTGPVMCCWYDYWNIAPGPADGSDRTSSTWFLAAASRRHDDAVRAAHARRPRRALLPAERRLQRRRPTPRRTPAGCAARGRCGTRRTSTSRGSTTRSGSSRGMRETHRAAPIPDTPLVISEWNFGADSDDERRAGDRRRARHLRARGRLRGGVLAQPAGRAAPAGSPSRCTATTTARAAGSAAAVVPADAGDDRGVGAYARARRDVRACCGVMLVNRIPDGASTSALDDRRLRRRRRRPRTFTYGPDDLDRIVAGRRVDAGRRALTARPRPRSPAGANWMRRATVSAMIREEHRLRCSCPRWSPGSSRLLVLVSARASSATTDFGTLGFAVAYVGFFTLVASLGTSHPADPRGRPRPRRSLGRYVYNAVVLKLVLVVVLSVVGISARLRARQPRATADAHRRRLRRR